jgi:hypothetical protein
MLEEFFQRPKTLCAQIRRSRFAPDLEDLAVYLKARGNTWNAQSGYMRAAVHLVHCLELELLPLREVGLEALRRFVREHGSKCSCSVSPAVSSNFRSVAPHLFRVMRERHGLRTDPPGWQSRSPCL